MATYTSNYGWTKPSGSDNVDISVLNDNLDDQDSTIHDAFLNMAPPFSESSTYAVDDIVLYTTGLYKCHTAVVAPGSWTGSTNWQVYKLSEGGSGGGGTSNYNDLTNKPSINGVTLSGNKTTSDLGIDKTAVGLGNVPNVSTNDQEPTFTEASTRNNIASGEKLSVILGKVQKFFNDLKTVAFSGSYTDLSDKPTIPAAQVNSDWNASSGVAEILNKPSSYTPSSHKHGNIQNGGTLQTTDVAIANGDKLVVTDSSNSAKIARTSVTFDGTTTTQALSKKGTFETFSKFSGSYTDLSDKPNAEDIMMSDGETSVENAIGEVNDKISSVKVIRSVTADGVKTYSELLDELRPYITTYCILEVSDNRYTQSYSSSRYGSIQYDGTKLYAFAAKIASSNSEYVRCDLSTNVIENRSANKPTQGTVIRLVFPRIR